MVRPACKKGETLQPTNVLAPLALLVFERSNGGTGDYHHRKETG
jgi:hypothetical protein